FRIDPALDRMAALHDVALAQAELVAGRDANLLLDDVDPRHELGHRVLDLNPRIHFDEVEFFFLVEEFERAGAAIADLAARFGGALADSQDRTGRDARRPRFLDNFLVAALHRAIALEQ